MSYSVVRKQCESTGGDSLQKGKDSAFEMCHPPPSSLVD